MVVTVLSVGTIPERCEVGTVLEGGQKLESDQPTTHNHETDDGGYIKGPRIVADAEDSSVEEQCA